jgi:hypothetical protein
MAGLGTKLWTSGEVVTAAGVNGYLQDQVIGTYASTTARDAAFGGAGEPTLSEGMFAYTTDTNTLWFYKGTSWINVLGSNIGETSTSNRNGVINGGMSVWQRGTSFTSNGSQNYSADRFSFFRAVADSTLSRQTTSDTTNLPQIQYCARIQRTAATSSTSAIFLTYSFETADSIRFVNRTATFSFYARAGANYSSASSGLTASLVSGTGTDQNTLNGFTGGATVATGTATLTTTWQRFQYTGTVASTATQLGININFTPVGTAGAADYFEVTGVQVELGSVATPFETEDYGTTLAKCQRYYQRTTGLRNFGLVTSQVAADAYGFIPLPCTMRVAPTSVDSNTLRAFDLVNAATTISSLTLDGSVSSESYAAIKIVTTGMTAFRTYYIIQNGATSYLGFSAEL